MKLISTPLSSDLGSSAMSTYSAYYLSNIQKEEMAVQAHRTHHKLWEGEVAKLRKIHGGVNSEYQTILQLKATQLYKIKERIHQIRLHQLQLVPYSPKYTSVTTLKKKPAKGSDENISLNGIITVGKTMEHGEITSSSSVPPSERNNRLEAIKILEERIKDYNQPPQNYFIHEQIQHIKDLYFFSLGVTHKLQQVLERKVQVGTHQIPLGDLYQQLKTENVAAELWSDWIHERLGKVSEENSVSTNPIKSPFLEPTGGPVLSSPALPKEQISHERRIKTVEKIPSTGLSSTEKKKGKSVLTYSDVIASKLEKGVSIPFKQQSPLEAPLHPQKMVKKKKKPAKVVEIVEGKEENNYSKRKKKTTLFDF
eukprot:TRINITY_DN6289_c0_g1_i1.p1 TRINITY_DN6289_c0_g1~~TRINITY_DN6289_c0_g1_i1.p1  ORF type:complete len:367 (-),score=100.78 TRINITY_DN6289_c0_g1_i1:42-1142(-)